VRARLRLPGGNTGTVGSGQDSGLSGSAPTAWLSAAGVGATALLRLSFSSREGSPHFYLLSTGLTATLTAGALGAGPVRWYGEEWRGRPGAAARDVVGVPVLVGAVTFAGFYGAARVVRKHPALRRVIASVFRYADEGSTPLVVLIAASGAVAEELFYRGALWRGPRPLRATTLAYVTSTSAAGNPALILAGLVTSVIFGWQREASGGVLAPAVTHITWSLLMLRHIPQLFRDAGQSSE
jgi:membrane protease YdiL (CAAX protease family)